MQRTHKAALAGLLTGLALLAGLLWLDARESRTRRADLQKDTRLIARQFTSRLASGLERHLIGLQQMANFWSTGRQVTEAEFSAYASSTLRLNPMCQRISFVDAGARLRYVFPAAPNQALLGFDTRRHPEGHETLQRAREVREPALSPPLRLLDDEQGFLLIAPIFKDGSYTGSLVCAFRSKDFFGSLLLAEVADRYQQAVEDSGTLIFKSTEATAPAEFRAAESFHLGGRTWDIQVAPTVDVAAARLGAGRPAFWVLGSLVALLLGTAAAIGAHHLLGSRQRLHQQAQALRETRARLDSAMDQLLQAEKLAALGELVAGVAHEINSPLTGIQGYAELLLAEDLPAEDHKRAAIILRESIRAGKIVRNLLAFARKQPPEKKHLDLNGIVEATLELKGHHLRVNNIQVDTKLARDLPRTLLDAQQIQQVLINLLNNAEQALGEVDGGGSIRIATWAAGDRLCLEVSDNGPGIPAEIQGRIFDPFFTTKPTGKGTGLGLSVCYGIIQEHAGRLSLRSRPGPGASFLIELPVVEGPRQAASPSPAAPEPPGDGQVTILVVDDEPSVRDLFAEYFSHRGHRVVTASDAPEALQAVGAHPIDVIISDMKMPTGSGRDLYAGVRQARPDLAWRIIFTTGDGASAETREFLEETGNRVIHKPCSLGELGEAVHEALAGPRPGESGRTSDPR